jgi:hypothetical protein
MTATSVASDRYHPWTTYMWASEEARRRGDRRAGTDHLVLGLLREPTIEALLGVSLRQARDAIESLDREALGALGLGPGVAAPPLPMREVPQKATIRGLIKRLRPTPAANKVLQEAGKPMRRGKHITARQVLIRILDLQPPDPAALLLAALEVNTLELRRRLDATDG